MSSDAEDDFACDVHTRQVPFVIKVSQGRYGHNQTQRRRVVLKVTFSIANDY